MVGFFISMLSVAYASVTLILSLILYRKIAEPGIPTLIVALFFFGGVQIFFMGMIGEYILAIYAQVREKPVVFERERINFGAGTVHSDHRERIANLPNNPVDREAGTPQ